MIPELKKAASPRLKAWAGWARVFHVVRKVEHVYELQKEEGRNRAASERERAAQTAYSQKRDREEALRRQLVSLEPGDKVGVTIEGRPEQVYTVKARRGSDVVLDGLGNPVLTVDSTERDQVNVVSGAGVRRVQHFRLVASASASVPAQSASSLMLPQASDAAVRAYEQKGKGYPAVVFAHGIAVLARFTGEVGLILGPVVTPKGKGGAVTPYDLEQVRKGVPPDIASGNRADLRSGWDTTLATLAAGQLVPVTLAGGVKRAAVAVAKEALKAEALKCVWVGSAPHELWGESARSLGLGAFIAVGTDGNRAHLVAYEGAVPYPVLVRGEATGLPGAAWAAKDGTTVLANGAVFPGVDGSEFPNFVAILPKHAPTEVVLPAATVRAFLTSKPRGVVADSNGQSAVFLVIGDDYASMLVQWRPGHSYMNLEHKVLAEFPVDLIRSARSDYRGVFAFNACFVFDALVGCAGDARWLLGDSIGISGIFCPGQIGVVMPIRLDDVPKHIEKMRALMQTRSRGVGTVTSDVRVSGVPSAPGITGARLAQLVSRRLAGTRSSHALYAGPVNKETWVQALGLVVRFAGHAVDTEYRYSPEVLTTLAKTIGTKPVTQLHPGDTLRTDDAHELTTEALAPFAGPYRSVETPDPALLSVLATFANEHAHPNGQVVVAVPAVAVAHREGFSHVLFATDGSCLHVLPANWPNGATGVMPSAYVTGPLAVSETTLACGNVLVKLLDPKTPVVDAMAFLAMKFTEIFTVHMSIAQVKSLLASIKKFSTDKTDDVTRVSLTAEGTAYLGRSQQSYDKPRLVDALSAMVQCAAPVQMIAATRKGAEGPTLFFRQADARGLLQMHVVQGLRYSEDT